MDSWKCGLTIRGENFNQKDLLLFCSDQIVSVSIDPWEKEIYRFIITWLSDDHYIIQFSSGTTGKPKELRLSKQSMITSAINTCEFLNLKKKDTALLCMPLDYIAGKMMIIRSMVSEMDLYPIEPKSMPDIQEFKSIDFCAMVPLQVINLLTCKNDLEPVKKLIIGGAEINSELEELVLPLKTKVYGSYGMAETCSHVALRRLNGSSPQHEYIALPGVKLSTDERDCLIINASYLPSPVFSNDIVKLTSPQSFIWLGRYDNLINSGGIKIVPEEVESLIYSKTLLNCIAIGLPDKKLGQKLVLVFEKNQAPDSFNSLNSDLEDFLPRRWRPKDMITIEHFPRNSSLKIDRKKLVQEISNSHK